MVVEAKVRKIGTGFGILIPKKTLEEVGAREGTVVIVKRIERPVKEIRGILKGSRFRFERKGEDRDLNDR
jgi:bifunctional DNA-binding transcriptional regulator/antitoxin component of YhaV-PrlF toxin-antitoxin module